MHGRTRGDAIRIMRRALNEFMLKGEDDFVKTTVPLHQQILDDEWFCTGNIDTQFIKHRLPIYAAAPKIVESVKWQAEEDFSANTFPFLLFLCNNEGTLASRANISQ